MNFQIRLLGPTLLVTNLLVASCAMAAETPAANTSCEQAASLPDDAEKTSRLYLSGECALKRLQYREAIKIFSELFSIEPNPVFRAELGRSYLGAQEFERARELFLLALQSNPPPDAKKLLQVFLQMADQQRTQAKDWFATVAVGVMYDSNINSGPVNPDIKLYGLPFTMSQDGMPKSDRALHPSLSAVRNHALDNDSSWQTDATIDVVSYTTYSRYSTGLFGIDTGPHMEMAGGKGDFYFPVGVSRVTLGSSGYSAAAFLAPQASFRLGHSDLLIFSPSIVRTTFDASPAMNSDAGVLGLSWRHLASDRWTIEPSLKFSSEHADDNAFSNSARSAGLSVSGSLPYGLRFASVNLYTWADYRAMEAWADASRKDKRRSNSLSMTKDLAGGYYLTLSLNDTRSDSNLGLYSTARRQLQLQTSKSF